MSGGVQRKRCIFCHRDVATQADWDRNGELNDEQAGAAGLDALCWEPGERDGCLEHALEVGRPVSLQEALEALDEARSDERSRGAHVYLASSWRNEQYPAMLARFRQDVEVYDFRDPERAFDWRQIDPEWDGGPISMERYKKLLDHPRAVEGFEADMDALRSARAVVLLNPSGASAHLEAGWAAGAGKPLYVLTEPEQRPDLMYRMATLVTADPFEILAALQTEEVRS